VFLTAIALALAAPVSLPPVEQCRGDADFARLRQQVQKAVDARDLKGLMALMSDDVRVSFGGQSGPERFSDFWTASEQDQELLWAELGGALRLGCAQAVDGQGNPYRAIPAMFVTGDGLDGFTTWVSLPSAVLRAEPDAISATKMRLPSWTVLEEVEHDGGSWVEVRTPKGRSGYVSTDEVRSLLDYRLIFGRRDGQWRITAFVAGD
jgi:hypothetical protein